MKRFCAFALTACLLAACAADAGVSPSPAATPTPSPAGSPYLRAWVSQALPPEITFGWLPMLTIQEGVAIDGNVAVPAIYPGPLMIEPHARVISEAGEAAIVELARDLGLLEGVTDFLDGRLAPGGQTAHVLLIVDGVRHELSGDPAAAAHEVPGTPGAFSLFWQRIGYLDDWLEPELGPVSTYLPARIAVVAMLPDEDDPTDPIRPEIRTWPLETSFAEFGLPVPVGPQAHCATVSGDDLDVLLPILRDSNQLTLFVDDQDEVRSLMVRVLVPDEVSPCADEG